MSANVNESSSSRDEEIDFNAIMGRKKSSLERKRKNAVCENISCVEIYEQIINEVQENREKNSKSRTAFASTIFGLLKSIEEFLDESCEKDEDIQTELIEMLHTRIILQDKLSNKLNLIDEQINDFLESTKRKNENMCNVQNTALEKFSRNVEKYKTLLPDLLMKEQAIKMEAITNIVSIFTD